MAVQMIARTEALTYALKTALVAWIALSVIICLIIFVRSYMKVKADEEREQALTLKREQSLKSLGFR